MFPYAMLATTGIFYSNDWPKRLFTSSKKLKDKLDPKTNKFYISKLSEHCIYEKIENDNKEEEVKVKKVTKSIKIQLIQFF